MNLTSILTWFLSKVFFHFATLSLLLVSDNTDESAWLGTKSFTVVPHFDDFIIEEGPVCGSLGNWQKGACVVVKDEVCLPVESIPVCGRTVGFGLEQVEVVLIFVFGWVKLPNCILEHLGTLRFPFI